MTTAPNGPGGGGVKTITVIGTVGGDLTTGGKSAKVISVFSIPATVNATADAVMDVPSPGAVALRGTAQLCASGNPYP